MAKYFGQFVGTPLQSLRATGSGFISNFYKDSRDQVLMRDSLVLNNNVIGDQISLGTFKSTTWFNPTWSHWNSDNLGAGVTLNIGDATYPAGLASALSLSNAKFFPIFSTPDSAIMGGAAAQVLWQWLGYPTDPARPIELLATFGGANPSNGGVAWQFTGRNL